MIENLELNLSLDPIPKTNPTDSEVNTYIQEVLDDYALCVVSREISLLGRREVLTGKGKFGISGDGKEVVQVALSKFFKKGDWRSGYYRDQTLMMACGICSPNDFFAQLYADTENDHMSGGRQMNAHFATPNFDNATGEWISHINQYNSSADISSTAGQMARAVGLALASKKYREISELRYTTSFSHGGSEVCFCTIGDASTSEGAFWEAVNAAGVMRIPLAIFIWDDGYGISVPTKYQTTKGSISDVLKGFELNEEGEGINIYKAQGWDYPNLISIFEEGIENIRQTHIPAIFHITELTQPQGHSTSGSHERYKDVERLTFEKEMDCNAIFRKWILDNGLASENALVEIELVARKKAREAKNQAWKNYFSPIKIAQNELLTILKHIFTEHAALITQITPLIEEVQNMREPCLAELVKNARQIALLLRGVNSASKKALETWVNEEKNKGKERYNTHLYSSSPKSALRIPVIHPEYGEEAPIKNGYEIINEYFDKVFEKYHNVFAFGEDVGHIGDVNQGFMNLQAKYGVERIFDTGIREWTIIGQAIGMAMRGLRPIAEIQYLDYLVYALSPLTDDLACLRYRTNNIQQAPCIIRSRGHRLEGIWHSGSPMGMIINALRGIYVCVPRNFVQAAGMYNTLLQSDDPGLVIESLNGYRLKEKMPDNIGEFTVPLGMVDILKTGKDITLVTYGSCVRIAEEAVEILKSQNIFVELIDIQTLIPFDLEHTIVESLKKTNRILFIDEDVPGGATAYMMQEVLEKQGGYRYLDCPPRTLTAKEHRTPYGTDGDYYTKPNTEDIIETVVAMMEE